MADSKYKFNGDSVGEWFKFSRNIRREARNLYGDIGAAIWANNAPDIDEETVGTVAQDVYWQIERRHGRKAADNYWEWDYFWTIAYQQKWRNDAMEKIVDCVESVCEGKALKFMAELKDEEKPIAERCSERSPSAAAQDRMARYVLIEPVLMTDRKCSDVMFCRMPIRALAGGWAAAIV